MTSEHEFPSRDLLPSCRSSDVKTFYHEGTAGPLTVIAINATARFVKIQRVDYSVLALDEVEVFAKPNAD